MCSHGVFRRGVLNRGVIQSQGAREVWIGTSGVTDRDAIWKLIQKVQERVSMDSRKREELYCHVQRSIFCVLYQYIKMDE